MSIKPQKRPHYIIFIETLVSLNGKDRVCRVIQYFVKCLTGAIKFHLIKDSKQRDQVTYWYKWLTKLYDGMSIFRKSLRFGKEFQMYWEVQKKVEQILYIKSKQNQLSENQKNLDLNFNVKYIGLKLVSEIFQFLSGFTDHGLYFYKTKLIKANKQQYQKIDEINEKFVLINLLCAIFSYVLEIKVISLQIKQDRKTLVQDEAFQIQFDQNLKQYKEKQKLLKLDILKAVFDIPENSYFLELPFIGSGVAGFFSTLSSVIGIYQIWK